MLARKDRTRESALADAWAVLDAAHDLGDHDTVERARRVIDCHLNNRAPGFADAFVIAMYFGA